MNSKLTALAVFAAGILVGWAVQAYRPDGRRVYAQPARFGGVGGIMAFTGQLDKDSYGIVMVDVDAGTLWIYQMRRPGNQLKLVAARSYMHDRYLEEYNCAEPTPSQVSQLQIGQQESLRKIQDQNVPSD